MQRTAVIWVVYTITHSAFLIGVTIFAEQFPSFLFSIPGGVAADRYNRYTIIKICQVGSMIQAVLLAALVITGHTVIWEILALSVLLGIINAFDIPARQSMLHDVVSNPDHLPNAVSLTTATASLAQLLGPALSGIVLSAYGAGVCFLLNAASFGGVILSIMFMKLPVYEPKTVRKKVIAEFSEGLAYIKNTRSIGLVVLMTAVISLMVLPYNTVLPVFAKVIFKGGASTFGYINSFVGIGAVTGTVFLASRKPGGNLKKILFISAVVLGVGLVFFSQIRYFPLAMVFAAMAGFGAMGQYTATNIMVQSGSDPAMRGRAIGIMLMAIFGMAPLGSLITGAVSERFGAPATVLAQGIIAIIIALIFARFLLQRNNKKAAAEAI
jgi:MFS family permease